MKNYYLTSESVTEGHPDKICDKISDYILDEALKQDKNSKMAVEATIKDDLILIYGEATTNAKLNYEQLAKQVLKEIGYTEEYNVIVKVNKQSIEINNAVNKDKIMAFVVACSTVFALFLMSSLFAKTPEQIIQTSTTQKQLPIYSVKTEEKKIVKRKSVEVKPMDEEEAVLQMELLGHTFFVFKNVDTEKINVVYKRNDGDYGIIEAN